MSVQVIEASSRDYLSGPHPAYLLIELGNQYESHQMQLILDGSQRQRETTNQLKITDEMMTLMIDLSQKKEVNQTKLLDTVYAINETFPDLNFHDFMENFHDFTPEHWSLEKQKLVNLQKRLFASFDPENQKQQQWFSDNNKVHEIIAAIVKLYSESTTYAVRKQVAG
ncbi:MAG: hypothetical protein HYX48_05640 [Chlamydiales bacterium]|nr:hypothetical protein [Chlamydiales bacterium]